MFPLRFYQLKKLLDKVTDDLQEVEQAEPLSEAVPEVLDISPDLLFQRLVALEEK